MTQIITITDDWLYDLQKGIYKFIQEYDVEPHMYANPLLGEKIITSFEFVTAKQPVSDDVKCGRTFYFQGYVIEFDESVDKDTVILKA